MQPKSRTSSALMPRSFAPSRTDLSFHKFKASLLQSTLCSVGRNEFAADAAFKQSGKIGLSKLPNPAAVINARQPDARRGRARECERQSIFTATSAGTYCRKTSPDSRNSYISALSLSSKPPRSKQISRPLVKYFTGFRFLSVNWNANGPHSAEFGVSIRLDQRSDR